MWPINTYPPVRDEVLYIVGDIHGRLDCLLEAESLVDRDRRSYCTSRPSTEIYLGDFIDRGPNSKGVLDRLLERRKTMRCVFLSGNHEIMMKAFLSGDMSFDCWRDAGGAATLRSYGFDWAELRTGRAVSPKSVAARINSEHHALLDQLLASHLHGDYCFVHAGLRPRRPIAEQTIDDLVWIRDDFLTYTGDFGRIVIHGHTPVDDIDFRPNRINIDTGAYRTGRLSVLKIADAGAEQLSSRPTNVRATG